MCSTEEKSAPSNAASVTGTASSRACTGHGRHVPKTMYDRTYTSKGCGGTTPSDHPPSTDYLTLSTNLDSTQLAEKDADTKSISAPVGASLNAHFHPSRLDL